MDFSDSDGEIPDIDLSVKIQPYMYEPVISKNNLPNHDHDSDTDSTDSADDQDDTDPIYEGVPEDEENWCSCNNCVSMPTPRENKCCKNTNIVDGKVIEGGLNCITEHEGFIVNCLNRHVLETSYYEYRQENGPLDQQQEKIHEIYRYIAYRRFVRWVYQVLGKKNRRILPSCVVSKIRKTFPSQQYCGFKYPN